MMQCFLEKLSGKEILYFYWIRRFITVLTRACNKTLYKYQYKVANCSLNELYFWTLSIVYRQNPTETVHCPSVFNAKNEVYGVTEQPIW